MRKTDLHPSKYFKAADFEGPLTLTIEMARPEKFENGRDEEKKLVVYFKKTKSGLVIGPIVWGMIADIVGTDETEKWPGHRLKLVRETTMFGGKRVPCIAHMHRMTRRRKRHRRNRRLQTTSRPTTTK